MKILYWYTIREFLESFFFGLVVFSLILLFDQIFQLIDLILSKGISVLVVLKLFILILPNIFSLAIPMAVLFGVLLAFGRLSEDNEITALRSAGLSYYRFTGAILVMVAVLSGALLYFNQYLSPRTHQQFRSIYQEILKKRPMVKFEEGAITSIGDYRLFIKNIDPNSNLLRGVNIYKFAQDVNEAPWRISASSAVVTLSPHAVVFNLFSGMWQKPNPARPESQILLNFSQYRFVIPFDPGLAPVSHSLREMTSDQLRAEIRSSRQKKMPVSFFENEYWLRWVLALAPLVFALIGIPLGISTERGGKGIGFGLSLVVIFGYYILLVTGLNVGEKGIIPPRYILWLPDAAVLAAGVFLWRRMIRS